ncbi:MAG TPA: polymer-forming cytoskeletal protein [Candidatus Saccharimonadia bacterium]
MARKIHEDALGVAGAETIIGTGVKLKGNLITESDLVIDGRLEGNITAAGNVSVGVNAHITGDISGVNVSVAGELHGNISAQNEASILATGQVRGNISAGGLAIASGGIFIGQSQMEAPGTTEPTTEPEAGESEQP